MKYKLFGGICLLSIICLGGAAKAIPLDDGISMKTYDCQTQSESTVGIVLMSDYSYVPTTGGTGNWSFDGDRIYWESGPLADYESSDFGINQEGYEVFILEGRNSAETQYCFWR